MEMKNQTDVQSDHSHKIFNLNLRNPYYARDPEDENYFSKLLTPSKLL